MVENTKTVEQHNKQKIGTNKDVIGTARTGGVYSYFVDEYTLIILQ